MTIHAYSICRRDPVFEVSCRNNPGNPAAGQDPFPVLEIGNFALYPSLNQLRELRDNITAFLESEAAALTPSPNPSEQQGAKL